MVEYFYTGDYENCGSQSRQTPGTEKKPAGDHVDKEENDVAALCLHAQMFALAEMYQIDPLQSLAVTKYGKELERGASMQDLLGSIPDVYQLTPSSVRPLRDRAVMAVRTGVRKPTRSLYETLRDHSGDEATANTVLKNYDVMAVESPEFLKDLLSSYIRNPLLGHCSHCAGAQPQPVEPLQMKCLNCGKGGARLLQ